MRSHRVVVTGMGCVSPYGVGVSALWKGIREGRSALRRSPHLDVIVGAVPSASDECDAAFDVEARFSVREQREKTRAALLALTAADEALADARLVDVEATFHDETGVNFGTGICDLEQVQHAGQLIAAGNSRRVSPLFVPRILTNTPAGYMSMRYGLKGGTASATTACATGVSCIGEAFALIQSNRVRRMLAGSAESCLTSTAVVGFQRMRALASGDTPSISRPFDAQRNGFVLAEGAGVLVLERLEDAQNRGAQIYAEILGYGMANDAHHIASPRADGSASTMCMKRCLQDARLDVSQVGYINAHATSTIVGDRAEAISIAALRSPIATSSIKGHIGHCVSAAGALETIVGLCAIRDSKIPPTLNLHNSDIDVDVDLVCGEKCREWLSNDRRVMLKNSFGFGGAFVTIAFGELD